MSTEITPWLTHSEALAYLKVSKATLARYAKEGLITRHKLAGKQSVRFRRDELDALLEPMAPVQPVPDNFLPATGCACVR